MDRLSEYILMNRLQEVNRNMHDDKDHRVFACFFPLGGVEKQRIK